MPQQPPPASFVVVALLMVTLLTACKSIDEDEAVRQKNKAQKQKTREMPPVVPALGIRG
jgi:uncharacterized lipoprotein